MAYEVLARKWRPQLFEEVVGQEHVTTTLANAVRQGRVAHAYLLSGLRGVGKTTTARILAKALNCEKGPTPTPCGECVPCQEIARGTSMDCLEIDGASNRGIEEIRSLRERIGYAPVGGKRKVYIIDEVHMLTTEAFNALLKTLEEPPPHAIFILATTHPRKVPPTILSRCQRFHFRRIPTPAIEEHLAKVAGAEGLEVEPEALALVARRADGSLRDAESLLEQVASLGEGRVSAADCRSFLGIMEEDYYFSAGEALLTGNAGRLMDLVDELVRQGGDPLEFAEGLAGHLRHLLVASLDPRSPALGELSREDLRRYEKEVKGLGSPALLPYLEAISSLLPALRRSRQPRLELEVALLSLAARAGAPARPEPDAPAGRRGGKRRTAPGTKEGSGGDAAKKHDQRAGEGEDEGGGTAEAEEASAEPPVSIPLKAVKGVWGDLVGEVRGTRRALAAFLESGVPERVDGRRVVLRFGPQDRFCMDQVARRENSAYLTGVLGKLLGEKVGLRCRLDSAATGTVPGEPCPESESVPRDPRVNEASAAAPEDTTQARLVEREPALRQFLEAFDGKILGVRERREGD